MSSAIRPSEAEESDAAVHPTLSSPRLRGTRAPLRRSVSVLLALVVTVLAAGAGLLAGPAPANAAEPSSCTFTPVGVDAVRLDASAEGWFVLFRDGVRDDNYSMVFSQAIRPAGDTFGAMLGVTTYEWRFYDPALFTPHDFGARNSITHDSPYLCEYTWTGPLPQTVTFAQPADATWGTTPDPIEVSATSGLAVGTESLTPEVCTVDGTTVTLTGVGECTLRATQPGGADGDGTSYAPASPVTRTFSVVPGALHQDVTFTDPDNMRLGQNSQVLHATADSNGPLWFESLTPQTCIATNRASNSTVSADAVGACTVRAHQDGGPDGDGHFAYNEATADRTFTIWPAALDQAITFPPLDDADLSDAGQRLAATSDSGLPVTYRSLTPQTCNVTDADAPPARPAGTQVVHLATGTCTIESAQAGNADDLSIATVYNAAVPVTRSFEIVAAPALEAQTVTVTGSHGYALSKRTAPVTFTSSARLPVTVTSTTAKVCTVTDGVVDLRSAGTCRLTAHAAGNDTYAASAPVTVSFPVWAAPTTPAKARAPRAVTVLGEGEGGYRVTATPAKVCDVAARKVVLIGAGTCTIVVRDNARVVRRTQVAVTAVETTKPNADDLDHVGSVRFGLRSAALTPAARRTLRTLVPSLRTSDLVIVYGNTQAYGSGDTRANRRLSAKRAAVVVRFLRDRGVKAKATTVALSSRNPLGTNDAANRRADIYSVR